MLVIEDPFGTSGPGLAGSDHLLRSNLSDQIAQHLRDDIVHGRIPAGTRLVQDELCARFGVSRMPVRDALQKLTHEGMLEQQGQQRVVVELGAEDLQDVHTLVAVLHGWAAARAAELATEEEVDQLDAICEAAAEVDDPFEHGQMAMEFHRQINRMARSQRLLRTLRGLQQTSPGALPFNVPEVMAPSKARHRDIVAAIRNRDAATAERLTRLNSLAYVGLLVERLLPRRESFETRS